MSNQRKSRVVVKVSKKAAILATDLLREVLEPGQRLLGPEPGDLYQEDIGGCRFFVNRLRCGGVDLREQGL